MCRSLCFFFLKFLSPPLCPFCQKRAPHSKFVEYRQKNYVARPKTTEPIIQTILIHAKRAQRKIDQRRVLLNRGNANNNSKGQNTTIVLLGEHGTGKTSIMCHLSTCCSVDLCMRTIVHVVGSTSGSLNVKDCLVRIINEVSCYLFSFFFLLKFFFFFYFSFFFLLYYLSCSCSIHGT